MQFYLCQRGSTPQPAEGHGKDGRREERWPGAENLNPLGVGRGAKNDYGLNTDGGGMNKQTISKLADFLLNCTVASFAVSVFGDKPWGAAVGVVAFLGALVICQFLGGDE